MFVFLPPGQASTLPLEPPPTLAPWHAGAPSPVVLQLSLPRSVIRKVEDLPWSEGYAYELAPGQKLDLKLHAYNFATSQAAGRWQVVRQPQGWEVTLPTPDFRLDSMQREESKGSLRIPDAASVRDGWVLLQADCGTHGRPVLAFRVVAGK